MFYSFDYFYLGMYLAKHSLAMKYTIRLYDCLQDQVITSGSNTLGDVIIAASELQHEYELTHWINSSRGSG